MYFARTQSHLLYSLYLLRMLLWGLCMCTCCIAHTTHIGIFAIDLFFCYYFRSSAACIWCCNHYLRWPHKNHKLSVSSTRHLGQWTNVLSFQSKSPLYVPSRAEQVTKISNIKNSSIVQFENSEFMFALLLFGKRFMIVLILSLHMSFKVMLCKRFERIASATETIRCHLNGLRILCLFRCCFSIICLTITHRHECNMKHSSLVQTIRIMSLLFAVPMWEQKPKISSQKIEWSWFYSFMDRFTEKWES